MKIREIRWAGMLADYGVHGFEEALVPDALEDYVKLREHSPVAHRRQRGAHPTAGVPAVAGGRAIDTLTIK